jgi:Ca2+ transporting ATPase
MEYSKEEQNLYLNERLIEYSKVDNDFFKIIFDNANIVKGKSSETFARIGNTTGLLSALKVNEKTGLLMNNKNDINFRKNKWGTNEFPHIKIKTFFHFFQKIFQNRIIVLLLMFALLYMLLGIFLENYGFLIQEGFSISASLLIIAFVCSYNNLYKERYKTEDKDKIHRSKMITVLRNNEKQVIPVNDLLVGDIIFINKNDIIAVDCVILSGNVQMQESAVTGVNELINKYPMNSIYDNSKEVWYTPFIYSGTTVVKGEGTAVVCSVGKFTVIGRIQKQLDDSVEKTSLNKKLLEIGNVIYEIVFILALVIFMILNLKQFMFKYFSYDGSISFLKFTIWNMESFYNLLNSVIIFVTVLLVILPEKLQYVVSLSLFYTIRKLDDEGNIVRKVDVCETIGGVNNICTDMIGTLTEGKMIVKNIYVENVNISNPQMKMSDSAQDILKTNIINNISLNKVNRKFSIDETLIHSKGELVDNALNQYFNDNDWDKMDFLLKSVIKIEVFRDIKLNANICDINEESNYKMFVKGSYNELFNYCTSYFSSQGIVRLTDIEKKTFKEMNEMYNMLALTSVFLCEKKVSKAQLKEYLENQAKNIYTDEILNDLTLICIIGFSDIPRKDLIEPIKKLINSGITLRIITGENIKTAISIAKELGIISSGEATSAIDRVRAEYRSLYQFSDVNAENRKEIIAMEGDEFRSLTKGYSTKVLKNNSKKEIIEYNLKNEYLFSHYTSSLKIIARASPDDRFLLVLGLKQKGEIVAVTGKAIKDAPALKKADVGFALGKVGTEIAKEAADIVIKDDKFSSILSAIKYGRNVYETIKKFIQFQLIIIIVSITIIMISSIILNDCALNSMKLLWINLLVDTFASISISTDPPTDDIFAKPPYKREEFPIKKNMLFNILAQAFYQILMLLLVIFYGDIFFKIKSDKDIKYYEWTEENGYHYTIVFNVFVYFQIISSFNSRFLFENNHELFSKLRNGGGFFLIQALFVNIHVLMLTYFSGFFRAKPLLLVQHFVCFLLASTLIPSTMIINCFRFDTIKPKIIEEIEKKQEIEEDDYLRTLLQENVHHTMKRRFTTNN